jgi:hypothetical protein
MFITVIALKTIVKMENDMTNFRHSEKYVKKILSLMPDDKPIQVKTILSLACTRNDKNDKPMGPNTLFYYLKSMDGTYIDKLQKTRKSQKEVYYVKSKTAKLLQLSKAMINQKTDLLLKDIRGEVDKTIKLELDYCEKHAPFEDKKEECAFVKEIMNEDELKLTLGRILVKHGNKLIKSAFH